MKGWRLRDIDSHEKTETRLIVTRSPDDERDSRSIVNKLVNSMPKNVLLRKIYEHHEQTSTQFAEGSSVRLRAKVERRAQFVDATMAYEPCLKCSSGVETLSGESTQKNDPDVILRKHCQWIRGWKDQATYSSDVSEIAVQSLLVKWKQRGLDREIHQDSDRDRCTPDEECIVVDHGADKLELIAVSKRQTRLLRYTSFVRTNIESLEQEATPLKKLCCVKLMDDAHAPEIISGQLNARKT